MVKIYKLKLTILQQEIMRFLSLNAGGVFNARRLSIELDVSQPAMLKAMPLFENRELINIEKDKVSGRFAIKLNQNKGKVIDFKRVENLRGIYESGLVEFLIDKFPGSTIILFGSFSKGEDSVGSDIDIAVINAKEKKIVLDFYEKLLNKKIIINFYSSFNKIHKNLKENIFNGIVLAGGIEL